MTSHQFEHVFKEMVFEMMSDIISYSESPSKTFPKLLGEIRELTGAKIATIFKCPISFPNPPSHEHIMLSIDPERKKYFLTNNIYEKLIKLIHTKMDMVLITDEDNIEYYELLKNYGIDISILMPIITNDEFLGSFLILGLPTKINLGYIIEGLKTLSYIFSLTFKGSIFYRNMEEMVEEKTKSLRESEKKYRNIIKTTNDGFWYLDMKGNILDTNDAYCRMSGYSRKELLSLSIKDLEINENPEAIENHIEKLKKNKHDRFESIHKKKDGTLFDVEVSVSLVINTTKSNFVVFIRNITERKLSEKELVESEARFKALHNASFGGITIHDEGLILECNAGLSELTGYSIDELIGMNGLLLIAEETRDLVIKNINSGYEKSYEALGIRKNGEKYPLRLEARKIPYQGKQVRVVEFRDITEAKTAEKERKKLEFQLQQSQKLEAIGTLAGGIAHDFNNILTPIMGYADMMKYSLSKEDPNYEKVTEILSSAVKARDLVQQLLTFSRKKKKELMPMDIKSTLENSLKLIRSSLPVSIKIHQNFEENIHYILATEIQIHQIVMNLCINASHAMENKDGSMTGNITVSLKQITIDANSSEQFVSLNPGEYVQLTIQDDGIGMNKEIQRRIFEPFFSTKEEGKGTGMGLAVVHGIVKSYNGEIQVYSEPGLGTTFRIYLPITTNKKVKYQKDNYNLVENFDCKIFVLDDRKYVTKLISKMLTPLGIEITISNDSGEALDILLKDSDKYDILITDYTMPDISGLEVAKNLRSQNINIPIILLTGHGFNINDEEINKAKINSIINKPVLYNALIKEIKKHIQK